MVKCISIWICFFLGVQSVVLCQNPNHASIKDLFKLLHQKYQVLVAYHEDLLSSDNINTSVNLDKMDLSEALDIIFKDAGIMYLIVEDNKVLLRKTQSNAENDEEDWVTVKGEVYDAESGTPLSFASVFVPQTGIGTITDDQGNFILKCKKELVGDIMISYLGYENTPFPSDKMKAGLNRKSYSVDEVLIIVAPPHVYPEFNTLIRMDEYFVFRLPQTDVFGKDQIRALQMLPGVAAGHDESGVFRIRGGQSDEVLVMMDGIPAYKIDHYYGIFSAVNPFYFDEVSLYKNRVPLQYESRTGGMLHLESSDRFDAATGHVEADFMKVGGAIHLSPHKRISLSVGGRINHTDPFDTPLAFDAGNEGRGSNVIDPVGLQREKISTVLPSFHFYDLNGKLSFLLKEDHKISISGMRSMDQFNRNYTNSFISRQDNALIFQEENLENAENWKNNGYSIRYEYNSKDLRNVSVNYYKSSYHNFNLLNTSLVLRARQKEREPFSLFQENRNEISGEGISFQYHRKDDFNIGLGGVFRKNIAEFKENLRFREFKDSRSMEFNQNVQEYFIYGSKTFLFIDRIALMGGIKGIYTPQIDIVNFSPTVNLNYDINKSSVLKSSFSRLFQNLREINFESRAGQNLPFFMLSDSESNIPQARSDIYMIGMMHNMGKLVFDIEAFTSFTEGTVAFLPVRPGVSISALQANQPNQYKLHTGVTQSQGIDFMASYNGKNYYSLLGYSISKTSISFEDVFRGEYFPSPNDRRHQLKMVNTVTLGSISFSVNGIYQTGMPFTSLEMIRDNTTRNNIDIENMIGRLPYYFRMDVSVQYDIKRENNGFYGRISLYNVSNRENVRNIQQTYFLPFQNNNQIENVLLGFYAPQVGRLVNVSAGFYF